MPALGAASTQHLASSGRLHAVAKSVHLAAFPIVRLIRPLHANSSSYGSLRRIVFPTWREHRLATIGQGNRANCLGQFGKMGSPHCGLRAEDDSLPDNSSQTDLASSVEGPGYTFSLPSSSLRRRQNANQHKSFGTSLHESESSCAPQNRVLDYLRLDLQARMFISSAAKGLCSI